jgi:hypothetical protein
MNLMKRRKSKANDGKGMKLGEMKVLSLPTPALGHGPGYKMVNPSWVK